MRKRRVFALWVLSALQAVGMVGGHNAWAQEAGDARRGLAYAAANCAECHAVLASEVTSPKRNIATFKTIAETPGMTGTALAVWLQTTHKSMPNFLIAPDDRANIIAYILSLRDQRTRR